jgi:hypothetical protein
MSTILGVSRQSVRYFAWKGIIKRAGIRKSIKIYIVKCHSHFTVLDVYDGPT